MDPKAGGPYGSQVKLLPSAFIVSSSIPDSTTGSSSIADFEGGPGDCSLSATITDGSIDGGTTSPRPSGKASGCCVILGVVAGKIDCGGGSAEVVGGSL